MHLFDLFTFALAAQHASRIVHVEFVNLVASTSTYIVSQQPCQEFIRVNA